MHAEHLAVAWEALSEDACAAREVGLHTCRARSVRLGPDASGAVGERSAVGVRGPGQDSRSKIELGFCLPRVERITRRKAAKLSKPYKGKRAVKSAKSERGGAERAHCGDRTTKASDEHHWRGGTHEERIYFLVVSN